MNESYEDYLKDESKLCGSAVSISFPESVEDILEVLDYCRREKLSITIQGGKTGLSGGAVPQGGHIMNLGRMNKRKQFTQSGGQVLLTVEAGMTQMELNKQISLLPCESKYIWVSTPTEELATVGGIIANRAKGIHAYHYGTIDHYLYSVTMVLADGTVQVIDTKNRPQELALVVGSEGVLGVITEATLILTERQQDIWGVAFFFEQVENAGACLDELESMQLVQGESFVSAIEFFDRTTMKLIAQQKSVAAKLQELPDIGEQYEAMIYVELEGREDEIMSLAEQLMELMTAHGSDPDDSWALSGENELEKMRVFRHAAPEVIGMELDRVRQTDERICKLTGDLVFRTWSPSQILAQYQEAVRTAQVKACVFGHGGSRHLLLNLLPEDYEGFQRAQRVLEDLCEKAQADGGCIAGEQGIGKLRKRCLGASNQYEALLAYKDRVDPDHIWNVGNIV